MTSAPSPLVLSDHDRRVEVSGFVLTETFRPAGLVLSPHFHEHANIALTVEGSFVETVGAEAYQVHPASVIFRPAGEKHSNRYGKTAARCLIIEVQPEATTSVTGQMPEVAGVSYWIDAALFAAAGVPTVNYGPSGSGAHEAVEWADLDSVVTCAQVLVETARRFCNP